MNFRNDINGLRAIAVIVVVLFHFGVPGFKGGFAGVDIFFVISGYLMTQIIFSKIEKGSFSLIGFYIDRGKRILPALAFLCAALLLAGWFVLLPSEYSALGKHAASAVTFLSNITFWQESGYFDTDSHEKWLLHTWSLSVEWQFYLIYPIAILVLRKLMSPKNIKWALVLTTILSLLLCIIASSLKPSAAFYLLPTRAWEMLAGGLVYLFAPSINFRPTIKSLLTPAGLILIILSVCMLDSSAVWPGYLAILPVTGAVLILLSNKQQSFLAHKTLQFIGTISYSIYLWHWPLAVAAHYYEKTSGPWITAAILTSTALGYLSCTFIENTTRHMGSSNSPSRPNKTALLWLGSITVIITLAGASVYTNKGAPNRVSDTVRIADNESLNRNPLRSKCFPESGKISPQCIIGATHPSAPPSYIYLGDSHALSMLSAASSAIEDIERAPGGILFMGYSSCPAIKNIWKNQRPDCNAYNLNMGKILLQHQDARIIVTNYYPDLSKKDATYIRYLTADGKPYSDLKTGFHDNFIETMCSLTKHASVYVTLPVPEFDSNVPATLARKLNQSLHAKDIQIDISTYKETNSFTISVMQEAAKKCGIRLLDPTPYLCKHGKCSGSIDGRPLYYDRYHLSEYGNRLLIPMFKAAFQQER